MAYSDADLGVQMKGPIFWLQTNGPDLRQFDRQSSVAVCEGYKDGICEARRDVA